MSGQFQSRLREQQRSDARRSESMTNTCRQMTERFVDEYPLAATLGIFGLGLGIGTLVGSVLAEPGRRRSHHAAETLGRRVLDSLSDIMPDAVHRRLGR